MGINALHKIAHLDYICIIDVTNQTVWQRYKVYNGTHPFDVVSVKVIHIYAVDCQTETETASSG